KPTSLPAGKSFTRTVNSTDDTTVSVTAIIGQTPSVDLAVTAVHAPDPVAADAPLTYAIGVTNNGKMLATDVSANIAIDNDVYFVPAMASQGCSLVTGTRSVQCSFGTIQPGAAVDKQIGVRAKGNL